MPEDFEKEHLNNLRKRERELKRIYENAIHEIQIGFSQITWNGEVFQLRDYPLLLRRIESQIKKLHAQIYAATVNGIRESWDLSNTKNNILVDKRLAGKKPSEKGVTVLYDPNKDALLQFIYRKEKGLNLSDRVWNQLDNYKVEMETALGVGVSEGRSAAEMASDLKRYLNEPDRLFRKVRQDDGTLKLSRAARNYHPGQGVNRSSFQNALRVAATETNMAYRSADWERWQTLPFVIGIEIVLSRNHPEFDICDFLVGRYPKSYKHVGFHPKCLCYPIPIMMSDAEYEKYEDDILAGRQPQKPKQVESIPSSAIDYYRENSERIMSWKNTPYWLRDNKQLIGKYFK
jgi:hypothetical protein